MSVGLFSQSGQINNDIYDQFNINSDSFTSPENIANLTQTQLNDYQDNIRAITLNSLLTANVANEAASETARYAYLSSIADAIGQRNLNILNTYSSAANSAVDQQSYLLRANMGLAAKSQEMSLLVSQFRERFFNTFIEAEKARLENTFQRSKQIVQGFKY